MSSACASSSHQTRFTSDTTNNSAERIPHLVSLVAYKLVTWAGIAQSVYRTARGWTVRGPNPGGGGARFTTDVPTDAVTHPASCTVGNGPNFRGRSGPGVALNTHPHLVPRLKKEQSYNATPFLGLRGQLRSELYLPRSCVSGIPLNHLNAKLIPICNLLALLAAHHILHVSRIRVNISTALEKKNMQFCTSKFSAFRSLAHSSPPSHSFLCRLHRGTLAGSRAAEA